MGRRRQFLPSVSDRLEGRVVLSQTTLGLSTVVGGLAPHLRSLNRKQVGMNAQINQVFDSFQGDYDQARATYYASIRNQPSPSGATTAAFTLYTTQRVSLLAQQLVNIFIQSPQGTARTSSSQSALKQLISTKIIGPQGQHPKGSLAESLLQTVPQPATSAPTSSLYTLSQDNAIETARVAMLNGLSMMKNGAFGVHKTSHY
jgi:hypothetical protein